MDGLVQGREISNYEWHTLIDYILSHLENDCDVTERAEGESLQDSSLLNARNNKRLPLECALMSQSFLR